MANYNLKEPKSNSKTLVFLRTKIRGEEFKYSLSSSMKVHPDDWDSIKQCYKPTVQNFKSKNEFLRKLQTKFDSLCDELLAEKRFVCKDTLRAELDKMFQRVRNTKKLEAEKTFEEHWADWKKELSQKRKDTTVSKKGYALTSIKNFSRECSFKLAFNTINRTFATEYREWAYALVRNDGQYVYSTDNTLNKYLSIVKEFMKWSYEEERHDCTDYKKIKELEGEYFDVFALSKNDIHKLMSIDFDAMSDDELSIYTSSREKLEYIRDGFVFRSLCGIRFSDFINLDKSNFLGNKLQLITKKTSNQLFFELHPIAYKILLKYHYNIPKLDNGRDNRVLKDIGRIAGFYEPIKTTKKRKGEQIYKHKERWEVLTTHVARKTFITNCLNAGMQDHVVMKLAGILKPATLQRYINVTNKDIEREVQKFYDYI
jgi:site-specific recombinase XerD